MLLLKRIETFCASHRLYHPDWTEEENVKIFGKCANKNGHGHNYTLEVSVCGSLNTKTGMLFSLTTLKEIIQTNVLNFVDHKHLNFDVPWLKDKIPTTEVLVESVWEELEAACKKGGASLHEVTIWETQKNSVTKKHCCHPAA